MKQDLVLWWKGRSGREQALLAIMATFAAIVLVWLAIVRPLDKAGEDAEARYRRALDDLVVVQEQAQQLAQLEAERPQRLEAPLHVVVSESAASTGLTVSRLQPETDGGVTLAIEAVKPAALFGWLAALERENGVRVRQMTAGRNQDATLSVQIVLVAGAR